MPDAVDKDLVRLHFDRSAPHYDAVTPVQARMAAMLLDRLPAGVGHVVEIGCGSGRLTAALRVFYPDAEIVAVDLAPAMLARARERLDCPGVRWVEADAEHWPLPPATALVVSNATVQWFHDGPAAVRRWREALGPCGQVCLTTFGPDTFRELRDAFARAEAAVGLPRRDHVLRLPDVDGWRATGLDVTEDWIGAEYPNARAFLAQVRAGGASLANRTLGRALYRRLLAEYPREDDHVVATYHVLTIAG